jgi:hypothetical protein
MERATRFNDLVADPDRMWQLRKEVLKAASRRRSGTPAADRPRKNDLQWKRLALQRLR